MQVALGWQPPPSGPLQLLIGWHSSPSSRHPARHWQEWEPGPVFIHLACGDAHTAVRCWEKHVSDQRRMLSFHLWVKDVHSHCSLLCEVEHRGLTPRRWYHHLGNQVYIHTLKDKADSLNNATWMDSPSSSPHCSQLVLQMFRWTLTASLPETHQKVNSPGGSLAEVTVRVGVTELNPSATGRRLVITEWTSETCQAGVWFTATVWVRTVVTLTVDTGTGCGHTREVRPKWAFIVMTLLLPACHKWDLLLSQFGPYLLEEEQYWQREPLKFESQMHDPFPPIPSKHYNRAHWSHMLYWCCLVQLVDVVLLLLLCSLCCCGWSWCCCSDLSMLRTWHLVSTRTGTAVRTIEPLTTRWSLNKLMNEQIFTLSEFFTLFSI